MTSREGGAGAGVSCTDDLTVDGIAPDSAAQTAGVQLGMRLVQLQHGGEGEGWDACAPLSSAATPPPQRCRVAATHPRHTAARSRRR